jgi:hypothetical protein
MIAIRKGTLNIERINIIPSNVRESITGSPQAHKQGITIVM